MADQTYYNVLGVSESATQEEIKSAYRSLLKKIHPDTVVGLSPGLIREANEVTEEIIEAYSVLSDSRRRAQYDQRLGDGRQQSCRGKTVRVPWQPRKEPRWHSSSDHAGTDFPQAVDGYAIKTWVVRHKRMFSCCVAVSVICILGLGPLAYDTYKVGQLEPELSRMTLGEQEALATACSHTRPAGYDKCVVREVEEWEVGLGSPDAVFLTQDMEASCARVTSGKGPAVYDKCLMRKYWENQKQQEGHPPAAVWAEFQLRLRERWAYRQPDILQQHSRAKTAQ